jgi:hypothetical protein
MTETEFAYPDQGRSDVRTAFEAFMLGKRLERKKKQTISLCKQTIVLVSDNRNTVTVNVVALAEGVWNGRKYPVDEILKCQVDKDAPVYSNHNHSKKLGTVTRTWLDGGRLMAELVIDDSQTCAQLRKGNINAVSIGANVNINNDTDPPECSDIQIYEVSLMTDGQIPACETCVIKSVHNHDCSKCTKCHGKHSGIAHQE